MGVRATVQTKNLTAVGLGCETQWYGSHITKLESASMYSLPLEVEKGLLCELDFFPFSLFGQYSNILVSLHEENRQALKIGHFRKNSR